jgi:hypothetical protein
VGSLDWLSTLGRARFKFLPPSASIGGKEIVYSRTVELPSLYARQIYRHDP